MLDVSFNYNNYDDDTDSRSQCIYTLHIPSAQYIASSLYYSTIIRHIEEDVTTNSSLMQMTRTGNGETSRAQRTTENVIIYCKPLMNLYFIIAIIHISGDVNLNNRPKPNVLF